MCTKNSESPGQTQCHPAEHANQLTRFLTVTGPCNATNSVPRRVVRSHAAKYTHRRKRESRLTQLEVRPYVPKSRNQANSREDANIDHGMGCPNIAFQQVQQVPQRVQHAMETDLMSSCNASQRIDLGLCCSRPISAVEKLLIDHCKFKCAPAILKPQITRPRYNAYSGLLQWKLSW
jgi:hypothetical protein